MDFETLVSSIQDANIDWDHEFEDINSCFLFEFANSDLKRAPQSAAGFLEIKNFN